MRSISKLAILALTVLAASVCLGMWSYSTRGTWPDTWPNELEPLRKQSNSIGLAGGGSAYEIFFKSREQFEAAWPHLVKLKSSGAPITLLGNPNKIAYLDQSARGGVCILTPMTVSLCPPAGTQYPISEEAARTMLKSGPPWPDDIKSPSGHLPEYVIAKDSKWVPFTETNATPLEHLSKIRARAEIYLIVDGHTVDLNRIALPPDTPIIDKRFNSTEQK